jgi:hypothetical protein
MTTTTKVVWGIEQPTPEEQDQLYAKAAEMATAGKTDGILTIENATPTFSEHTGVRHFTTVADAEEWIAFSLQYNPVSTEIIPGNP